MKSTVEAKKEIWDCYSRVFWNKKWGGAYR